MMGGDGFRGFPVRWQAHLVRIKRDRCETGKNKQSRFRAIFQYLPCVGAAGWFVGWRLGVGEGGEKSADFWRMWIIAMGRHGLDGS
jgi:hypothetical protein